MSWVHISGITLCLQTSNLTVNILYIEVLRDLQLLHQDKPYLIEGFAFTIALQICCESDIVTL